MLKRNDDMDLDEYRGHRRTVEKLFQSKNASLSHSDAAGFPVDGLQVFMS